MIKVILLYILLKEFRALEQPFEDLSSEEYCRIDYVKAFDEKSRCEEISDGNECILYVNQKYHFAIYTNFNASEDDDLECFITVKDEMIQLIACDNNQSDNHTVFLFELRIDKTFEDVKRIGFSVTDPYKKTTFCSLNINVEVYKDLYAYYLERPEVKMIQQPGSDKDRIIGDQELVSEVKSPQELLSGAKSPQEYYGAKWEVIAAVLIFIILSVCVLTYLLISLFK